MAPQTKRNRPKQTSEGCQTNTANPPQSGKHKCNVTNPPTDNTEKPTVPTTIPQMTTREIPQGPGAHDRNRRKRLLHQIGTGLDNHRKQNKPTIWIHC